MKVTPPAPRRPVTMVTIIVGPVDYPGAIPQDVRLAVTDPVEHAPPLTLVTGSRR